LKAAASGRAMRPALYSWREELPATLVRLLAYLGGLAALSIAAAQFFQAHPVIDPPKPSSGWVEIEKPFPAFALSIPEAADAPLHYAIRRHTPGNGRKDILSLGEPNTVTPYLQVEIYRPGNEIAGFADAESEIIDAAGALGPAEIRQEAPLASKFGALSIVSFKATRGAPRDCLGFAHADDDPRLQISGFFCQGGDFVERSTLACALDRLSLLSAGSEPKVGALFAKAELNRKFCGEHDPIFASTPKYKLLWKALATRPDPRRIGR